MIDGGAPSLASNMLSGVAHRKPNYMCLFQSGNRQRCSKQRGVCGDAVSFMVSPIIGSITPRRGDRAGIDCDVCASLQPSPQNSVARRARCPISIAIRGDCITRALLVCEFIAVGTTCWRHTYLLVLRPSRICISFYFNSLRGTGAT